MSNLPALPRAEVFVLRYLKKTKRMETYRKLKKKVMKKWLLEYMVQTKRKETWKELKEEDSSDEDDEEEEMRKADEARAKSKNFLIFISNNFFFRIEGTEGSNMEDDRYNLGLPRLRSEDSKRHGEISRAHEFLRVPPLACS